MFSCSSSAILIFHRLFMACKQNPQLAVAVVLAVSTSLSPPIPFLSMFLFFVLVLVSYSCSSSCFPRGELNCAHFISFHFAHSRQFRRPPPPPSFVALRNLSFIGKSLIHLDVKVINSHRISISISINILRARHIRHDGINNNTKMLPW